MTDLSHLEALQSRLTRETVRFNKAKSPSERAFRKAEMVSCEKEIVAEYKFLCIAPLTIDEIMMSDDELLAELES